MRTPTNKMRQAVLMGLALVALGTSVGCDDLLAPAMYTPDYGTSLYGGWNDYGSWGGYGSTYPDYGLYDPTNVIQDVVDYRQSVMDWSADAWSDYILQ